jgi:hypothetical protein
MTFIDIDEFWKHLSRLTNTQFDSIIYIIQTQKGLKMSKVATRVIEINSGEWVVQFEGGLDGWVQLGDVFATEAEAEEYRQEQLDSADLGDEE